METESSNMLKGLYTMANLDLSHNASVVPHMKINQCNSLINLINQIMETHTNKIILIEAEKAFDETENPFMMITLNNSEIVENFLKIKKKGIYKKPTANIINDKKLENVPHLDQDINVHSYHFY